ncbi:unnamed protein product [Polarella glacialis]|uniref:Pseudouridine synthase RsuA/RluA-like domain-containing protein n=1 Tax=Polarella glacialis TaxID=89957 RepID=A0A813DTW1_POLGL|nr:unnamed protein product [Polarella glacialis]
MQTLQATPSSSSASSSQGASCGRAGQQYQKMSQQDAEVLVALGTSSTRDEVRRLLIPKIRFWRQDATLATKVLSSLARQRLPHVANWVIEVMQDLGVAVNNYHCGAAISACEKAGHWQLALKVLLWQMPEMSIKANAITYNAAISACSRGGQWQLAVGLLEQMHLASVASDVVSYNAAISACAVCGRWQLGIDVLARMPVLRLVPDRFSFSAAISACSKGGRWLLATDLLSQMLERQVRPNEISFNAAITACEKSGRWQPALELLAEMPSRALRPNEISCSALISACEKGGQWQLAVGLLCSMPLMKLRPNAISYNAAISACEKCSVWQMALALLGKMPEESLMPDVISHNAAISACGKAGQWQVALRILNKMLGVSLVASEISYSASINACERSGQWQLALQLLEQMPQKRLGPNYLCLSAAIGACGTASLWQMGMELLGQAPWSEVCVEAAVKACEKGRQWQLALLLLHQDGTAKSGLEDSGLEWTGGEAPGAFSGRSWRLAKLDSSDTPSGQEAKEQLAREALAELSEEEGLRSPRAVATLLWSLASLGVSDAALLQAANEAVASRLSMGQCSTRDLSKLAWSLASLGSREPLVFEGIQRELSRRAEQLLLFAEGVSTAAAPASSQRVTEFAMAALACAWACSCAGVPQSPSLQQAILRAGRALSRAAGPAAVVPLVAIQRVWGDQSRNCEALPKVVLELSDRLVVYKPPGWQVDDGQDEAGTGRGWLSSFLHALLPARQWPILSDDSHFRGFLHRLDVPSSGLLLVAKSYEAYYDLRLQLDTGTLVRDYVVLCHGWMDPKRREVRAPVHWCTNGRPTASSVTMSGRNSRTFLKVLCFSLLSGSALSLLAIRIATGRRHQIRLHTAHIGHPTVCDGKYSGPETYLSDHAWCPRNFLHRYRLAFSSPAAAELIAATSSTTAPMTTATAFDFTSPAIEAQAAWDASSPPRTLRHQVSEPLPNDLIEVLQRVTPVGGDGMSAKVLSRWLSAEASSDAWEAQEDLRSALATSRSEEQLGALEKNGGGGS